MKHQVHCFACDGVFEVNEGTPLWWKAEQRAKKGFLDALHITGKECGCIPENFVAESDAPYRVFGYSDFCEDYNIPCRTFVYAVKMFLKCLRSGDCVFISGISDRVKRKVERLT